nr:M60 family metallopeptidase [uncultured Bacteroides sp.]
MKKTKTHTIKETGVSYLLLLLLIFAFLPLNACSDDTAKEVIPDNWLTISATSPLRFGYEGGKMEIGTLASGLDVEKIAQTFNKGGEDYITATFENGKLMIQCEQSYVEITRSTLLTLAYDDNHKIQISISQEASPSMADSKIAVASATATTEQPDLEIEKSFDGDHNSYFNSKYGGFNNWPFIIEYSFKEASKLDYIVYVPRTNDTRDGAFNEFTVYVTTADSPDIWKKVTECIRGEQNYNTTNIKLNEGIENVLKVRFDINSSHNNRICCAEMEFYTENSRKFDTSGLFIDNMGLKLKDGWTEKQLKQNPDEYLRDLSVALFNGNYDTSWRLADYRPYQKPDIMADKNRTNKYSLRDNPTGIYAKAGETLPIWVGKIYEGGKISMLIQDLNGGYNNFKTYDLKEGYNQVKVEIGGLIYILNHVDDDIPLPAKEATQAQKQIIKDKTVQVHFGAGKQNGYFDISKHSEADWRKILDNANYQDIDAIGRYSHVTWKVKDFKAANTQITKTLENTDRLLEMEWDFMGLFKYHKEFNNRMHLCIDYKAKSPNATHYRTVYNPGSSMKYDEIFCQPDKFAERCWGPAHEVGHCNQTRPGLKWAGMTEVTNNLMAMHVRWELLKYSHLLEENKEYENGYYGSAIEHFKTAMHCKGDSYDYCNEKLVPFWQLKLYMVDALGQKDFYRDLYEYYRNYDYASIDAKKETEGVWQLLFVYNVCKQAHIDFTDYFKKMGFLRTGTTDVYDYGDKTVTITDAQITKLETAIKKLNLTKKAPSNLHLITDKNWESFKE